MLTALQQTSQQHMEDSVKFMELINALDFNVMDKATRLTS